MINILINGVNGKMSQTVVSQIKENDNFFVICGVDNIGENNEFPVYSNINEIKEIPDVIIDFSIPKATFNILEFAKEKQIPIVIGTTGFSDEELEIIREYSKYIPIFKSGNMSFEINFMMKLVSEITKQLSDMDIEIIEAHHNNKKDAPSGTALMLAESINNVLDNKMVYEYNRHEKKEKREKNEIGIHSIRGGNIVGKHTVMFLGDNETFEITHTSTSKTIYANGALKAAEFIKNQPNGFYDMNNLISGGE